MISNFRSSTSDHSKPGKTDVRTQNCRNFLHNNTCTKPPHNFLTNVRHCFKGLSPSPCPSMSVSKFNILSMVTDNLMRKMDGTPILPVNVCQKRMHSSRMRTARSLTVSRSICHAHPPLPCHACLPATHAPHHARPPATHAPPAMHAPLCHAYPPPSCGQTDTCKNITFANFVCLR